MSKFLLVLNEAPYGGERTYNALRLSRQLLKGEGNTVKVFLMGDAVSAAKAGQKVPQGYYNAGDMLNMSNRAGAEIGVCGTCIDARGIADGELLEAATRGTMEMLATWTVWADKVLVF
ncbi:MAG: DsrE family protein [Rhodocyclales bacterium]|nr:DsrE family protein [Rhodocyclales bacterium]